MTGTAIDHMVETILQTHSECALHPRTGWVLWLTGLSGVGKSTVSHHLRQIATQADIPVLFLDGDELRRLFAAQAGHDLGARLRLAHSYGALCQALSERGANVTCATMSMFHAVQDWNRANIPRYYEVLLRAPLDELERRDPKGLYRRARDGQIGHVVGLHIPVEEPRQPHMCIENHGMLSAPECAKMIWDGLRQHFQGNIT